MGWTSADTDNFYNALSKRKAAKKPVKNWCPYRKAKCIEYVNDWCTKGQCGIPHKNEVVKLKSS